MLKSAWLLQVTGGLVYDTLQDDFKGNNNDKDTFQFYTSVEYDAAADVTDIIFFSRPWQLNYIYFIFLYSSYIYLLEKYTYYNVGTYVSTASAQFE